MIVFSSITAIILIYIHAHAHTHAGVWLSPTRHPTVDIMMRSLVDTARIGALSHADADASALLGCVLYFAYIIASSCGFDFNFFFLR